MSTKMCWNFTRLHFWVVPVSIRTPPMEEQLIKSKAPDSSLLKVEECPDFSILQSNYPYVATMEEMASNLKVWIFPNLCHFPWIFASQQRKAPGLSGIFAYIRIFSSIGGVRILTGTTLCCKWKPFFPHKL